MKVKRTVYNIPESTSRPRYIHAQSHQNTFTNRIKGKLFRGTNVLELTAPKIPRANEADGLSILSACEQKQCTCMYPYDDDALPPCEDEEPKLPIIIM